MTDGNIGADGARFRLFLGVLFLVFALGLLALLTVTGTPLTLRLVVFAPIWVGTFTLAESRTRVGVLNAARGVCSIESGPQRIKDDERRMELVRRAWRVSLHSVLYAVVLTVFLVAGSALLPWSIPGG